MTSKKLEPGMELWSVSSGVVKPWLKASRDAVKYIAELDGFVAVFPMADKGATLFYFATEPDGIKARNLMKAKGIPVGDNVCRWVLAEDGVPEFADKRCKGA